jgi:hypothetical protein
VIEALVERWEQNKPLVREEFTKAHPSSYMDVVKAVVTHIKGEEYTEPNLDPERIHLIDDGDYQGTLLFVIAAEGYQPSTYYAVTVSYGSCSGCDTLQSISVYSDETPTEEQVDQYMTLALHIVQGIRQIAGYSL